MRTNSDVDISTKWKIADIVKPAHLNALTGSVPFDYVVTPEMLEGKSGTVNVDTLLGGGKINATTGVIHVLINTVVPDNITLLFPADSVGGVSGTLDVHIHTIGAFHATFGTNVIPYISHYFHTRGAAEAVTLEGISRNMHVGAFMMESPLELPAGGIFEYEMALGELPVLGEDSAGTISRRAWMSNAIGIGAGSTSHAIATLLHYRRIGVPDTLPSPNWPLLIQWKGVTSGATGVLAGSYMFPEGTAVGVKAGTGYLVPRDKPDYGDKLLPPYLTEGSGALQYRNADGDWGANGYPSGAAVGGFVLSDAYFGCYPARSGESPSCGVKVTPNTTQLDVYTSLGLAYRDTGVSIPTNALSVFDINIEDMEEGQAVELNMHLVEFAPAKQMLHSLLGPEHFIGEWNSSTSYEVGALASITATNAQTGAKSYDFYRAVKGSQATPNRGKDPGSNVPEWWERVSVSAQDDSGAFHAATPFNSSVGADLRFIANETGSALPVLAWGYGTPPEVTGGYSAVSNNLKVTFSKAADWRNTQGSAAGIAPTVPVAASAKVIFTKIIDNGSPVVIVLTGGYCAPPYPNY